MIKLEGFDTVQIYENKYLAEFGYKYVYSDDYKVRLKEEIKNFGRSD